MASLEYVRKVSFKNGGNANPQRPELFIYKKKTLLGGTQYFLSVENISPADSQNGLPHFDITLKTSNGTLAHRSTNLYIEPGQQVFVPLNFDGDVNSLEFTNWSRSLSAPHTTSSAWTRGAAVVVRPLLTGASYVLRAVRNRLPAGARNNMDFGRT